MTKDEKIKEVMELVDKANEAQHSVSTYGGQDWLVEKLEESIKAIEAKLRQLIQ